MHYLMKVFHSMDFESTDDFSNWRVFDDNNDNVSWTIDMEAHSHTPVLNLQYIYIIQMKLHQMIDNFNLY